MKAEIIIEDNEVIRRLANYSDAAKISIEELIGEIIHDAVYGNDIKGSLEDTTKQGFNTWEVKANWQGPYMTSETSIPVTGRQFRHVQPDHARDLQKREASRSDSRPTVVGDFINTAIRERAEVMAALLKPKSESFERSGPTSSDEVIETDFKNTGGVISRILPTFDPVEKAAELLKPQEEQIEQSVTAADIMYLSWLDDAITAIKALPKGNVFVANQFLPKAATPEEARVFGKKLLQLITKHKLYASKRKGKSCMEYVKA